ncbi:hypothetical protein [Actinopolyspora saharensis]|uniref:Adenylate cyclase, class 3 n=1 Tax=Actinopolyspora saharensis TaxID=995062 RepID=A0A1H0Z4P7_9ACTN|nr:hypothetical protein [Actinopolyspora saharensis]SDQ22091.1 hypothetical protein SAMN04489718_0828 [Actinopolyspora saharensis]
MELDFPDEARALGEHTGILAVDVRGFGEHNTAQQQRIVDLLPDVLRQAARRANLAELWEGRFFRAFRGDGYLVGVRPDLLGAVVDKFFDALQAELRHRIGDLRKDGIEVRLRTSLHLGPVGSFEALLADSPTGKVMVDTGRMVDAGAVRALLDRSDPDVTLVASVLSSAVMEHVVEAGWTYRKPSEFVEAPLRVDTKEYSGTGYLRVPVPSGELLSSGLLDGQPEGDAESAPESESGEHVTAAPEASNTFEGTAEESIQTRDVIGGVHDRSVRESGGGVTVTGNGSTVAGRDLDQSSHKQEFSGRFHTLGDSNFGPSSGRRVGADNADNDSEAR